MTVKVIFEIKKSRSSSLQWFVKDPIGIYKSKSIYFVLTECSTHEKQTYNGERTLYTRSASRTTWWYNALVFPHQEGLPDALSKEMAEVKGAGHGIGNVAGVAGVPDVNCANYRGGIMDFLANKASGVWANNHHFWTTQFRTIFGLGTFHAQHCWIGRSGAVLHNAQWLLLGEAHSRRGG